MNCGLNNRARTSAREALVSGQLASTGRLGTVLAFPRTPRPSSRTAERTAAGCCCGDAAPAPGSRLIPTEQHVQRLRAVVQSGSCLTGLTLLPIRLAGVTAQKTHDHALDRGGDVELGRG